MLHVEESNETTHGHEHNELKKKDGWYESARPIAKNEAARKKFQDDTLASFNIHYSDDVYLSTAITHLENPDIKLGGPGDDSIPVHQQQEIEYGYSDGSIPKRFKNNISYGEPKPLIMIPEEWKGIIEFSHHL